jgi:hypothetical protein
MGLWQSHHHQIATRQEELGSTCLCSQQLLGQIPQVYSRELGLKFCCTSSEMVADAADRPLSAMTRLFFLPH